MSAADLLEQKQRAEVQRVTQDVQQRAERLAREEAEAKERAAKDEADRVRRQADDRLQREREMKDKIEAERLIRSLETQRDQLEFTADVKVSFGGILVSIGQLFSYFSLFLLDSLS